MAAAAPRLRITTWNVNGIRNPFGYPPWRDRRTFDAMFDILEADVVVMQELKIQRKDLRDDMVLVPGWDCYFSLPRRKKGYSGVGIYTRSSVCAPVRAEEGILGVLCPPNSSTPYCELPSDLHIGGYLSPEQLATVGIDPTALDAEGRCVILEFPAFVIFGVYSPANSSGMRDDFRLGFLTALDMRIRNLIREGKRVVVCGDLNVSREELDTANAEENMRKDGITHEDYISTPNRKIFNQLLEGGQVVGKRDDGREQPAMWDVCREFHPRRRGMFTHWEQKINARPGNYGSRIDFILCSLDMKHWFCDSNIQEGLMGSDHCPVYAMVKDNVEIEGIKYSIEDLMNAQEVFKNGKDTKQRKTGESPALSAKLMPEFDKRQSIKDMFNRRPLAKSAIRSDTASSVRENTEQQTTSESQQDKTDAITPGNEILEYSSQTTNSTTTSFGHEGSPKQRRKLSEGTMPKTIKRKKSATGPITNASIGKRQQSLKGFFQPKFTEAGTTVLDNVEESESESPDDKHARLIEFDSQDDVRLPSQAEKGKARFETSNTAPDPLTPPDSIQPSRVSSQEVIDPIVSKESWSRLFTKPIAPRCETHSEPCKIMKTKKTGFNCGREFWMCARPLGPSGTKEKNTQWRCPTFIWSSDWNGGKEVDA